LAGTLALGFTGAVDLSQVSLTAQQRHTFDATSASLFGVIIAATLLGALAVRTVTAEYSTGMIRATFSAMPATGAGGQGRDRGNVRVPGRAAVRYRRVRARPADLCRQAPPSGPQPSRRAASHRLRGRGASLVAIIGVGLGGLIRHTPGATTALTLIVVGDVTLGQPLPAGLRQYLPGTAIQAAVTVHRSAGLLTPDAAIAVLGACAAIAIAAALIRVAHRDA
jgi:hypothetical protein